MDTLKACRHKSIRCLIVLFVLGITLIYTFYSIYKINPDYVQIVPVLPITCWLLVYVDYVSLKTKIEILKEIEKAKAAQAEDI